MKKIKLYQEKTNLSLIENCVDTLKQGGVIVYPTDSVYAMGVSVMDKAAIDKLHQIKNVKKGNHDFSLICSDISMASNVVEFMSRTKFKKLKKNVPGAFTFVMNIHPSFKKQLYMKKNTIGIRIPDNNIPLLLAETLGHPILTTSLKKEESSNLYENYFVDPEVIENVLKKDIDLIIDGGMGNNQGSTVVDFVDEEPQIIRQGVAILR